MRVFGRPQRERLSVPHFENVRVYVMCVIVFCVCGHKVFDMGFDR